MIKLVQGFEIGSPLPIDGRLVLSREEMNDCCEVNTAKFNQMPDRYFTICKDDGLLYVYSKEYDSEGNPVNAKFNVASVNKTSQIENDGNGQFDSEGNIDPFDTVASVGEKIQELKDEFISSEYFDTMLEDYKLVQETSEGLIGTPIGSRVDVEWVDSSLYRFAIILKDYNDVEIARSDEIDLPTESVIIDAYYEEDSEGKWLILVLNNGNEIKVPVDNLISGLVNEDQFNAHVNNVNIHTNSSEKEAWNAKYTKPSSGIPKEDLSSDVQSSLTSAGTALQTDNIAAGTNVSVNTVGSNVVISATDTTYSAGVGINITNGVISASASAPTWDAIQDGESSEGPLGPLSNESLAEVFDTKQDKLVAGNYITLTDSSEGVVISGTGYSNADGTHDGLMSASDYTKLHGIAAGAEVNVQANWNETSSSSDAYIQNKPTIPSKVSDLQNDSGFTTNTGTVTSVRVQASSPLASSSSSASSTTLDTTISISNQDANKVLAGPSTGSTSAAPTFRALVSADIPSSVALSGTPTAPTAAASTNTTQIATTAFVKTAVDNAVNGLPNPMVFQGTVGKSGGSGTVSTIPTTGVVIGDTYKIIEEDKSIGASSSTTGVAVTAKIGDTIIATATTPKWTVIPSGDEPAGTVTSVAAGVGLNTTGDDSSSDGGTISSSGTLYLTKSGASAGSYGPSADASPAHGGTFTVPYVTVDKYGRVTAASSKTITLPASGNTDAKVQQTSISTNGNYPILLKNSANATQETNNVNATNLTSGTAISINPSTGNINAVKLNGVAIGDSPKFTDTTYAAEKGISLTSGKFGHSNTAVTAQTTQALYPITIDAYGHITGYGTAVSSMTPSSHTHGDITNSGDITATAAIASGDRLVINDESASKITNSSITFGSGTGTFLRNDGTWNAPLATAGYGLSSDSNGIKICSSTITIPSGNWTAISTASAGQISGGYYKTVTDATNLSFITSNSTPVLDINMDAVTTSAQVEALLSAWSKIYRASTGTNSITFYATENLGSSAIPINVKG